MYFFFFKKKKNETSNVLLVQIEQLMFKSVMGHYDENDNNRQLGYK